MWRGCAQRDKLGVLEDHLKILIKQGYQWLWREKTTDIIISYISQTVYDGLNVYLYLLNMLPWCNCDHYATNATKYHLIYLQEQPTDMKTERPFWQCVPPPLWPQEWWRPLQGHRKGSVDDPSWSGDGSFPGAQWACWETKRNTQRNRSRERQSRGSWGF